MARPMKRNKIVNPIATYGRNDTYYLLGLWFVCIVYAVAYDLKMLGAFATILLMVRVLKAFSASETYDTNVWLDTDE